MLEHHHTLAMLANCALGITTLEDQETDTNVDQLVLLWYTAVAQRQLPIVYTMQPVIDIIGLTSCQGYDQSFAAQKGPPRATLQACIE